MQALMATPKNKKTNRNVNIIFSRCKPIKCSPIHSSVLISKFNYITLFNKENKIENVNARYVRNSIIYKINIIG